MQVLVLSTPEIVAEFKQKFTSENQYVFIQSYDELEKHLPQTEVVFDFLLQDEPLRLAHYANKSRLTVFCHAVKKQLAELALNAEKVACTLVGFNGLPTMINRQYLEVSLLHAHAVTKLEEVCKALGTEYLVVEDRVGLVTPRIVCMIINEACYTLQEGTATVRDIDLGMKLGTNYPHGPFEWAAKIGTKNVYETLQAIYKDTKDERYKICPLLKTMYLKNESFA
ncbi:3-hydroxyacyl-CoA dehydrogenase [Adhaeribacter sp. BT258]|uniref:3-hydroxyacyl-CoA dehydrogenase n=1 Tax=Adhaeribacter terrigena TaxID=2793070 RepID=A0ABS1C283_9BACT|nr:3-hydroxyacyl-CoA dehydrogenase family protein [Adhaeribacter terrigena]MBK0403501.1 3-hydroxyacyl-CoA dehydrogenase [Adhaeribacter terrigena]